MNTTTQEILSLLDQSTKRANDATPGPLVVELDHFMYPDGPILKSSKGMHVAAIIGLSAIDDIELFRHASTDLPRRDAALRIAVEAIQAKLDAETLTIEADEHSEEAVAGGWDNDPTGSCHVTDSYRRAEAKWCEADALIGSALERIAKALKGETECTA